MEERRKSAGRMIRQAMWRQVRPKALFLGILLLCGLFLIGIELYRSVTTYKNVKTAEDIYGDFQVAYQLTVEDACWPILKKEKTSFAYKEYIEEFETSDGQMWISAMEKSSLEHEGIRIVEGRFPSAPEEVLCSREYLLRNDLEFGPEQEPMVTIKWHKVSGEDSQEIITVMPGEEAPERKEVETESFSDTYKIVGIYESTSYQANVGVIYFIRSLEYYKPRAKLLCEHNELRTDPAYQPWTDLYLVVRYPVYKGYGEFADAVFEAEKGVNVTAYSVNSSVLNDANIDLYGKSKKAALRLFDAIKYVIALLMAALLVAVIIVTTSPVKKSINLFYAIGIALKDLVRCQFWMAVKPIVLSAAVFSVLAFSIRFIALPKARLSENLSETMHSLSALWLFVALSMILYGVYLARIYYKRNWNAADNFQVKKKLKTPKTDSELIKAKRPFLKLADKNRKMHTGEHYIRVLSLAVTMGTTSFLLYFMPTTGLGYPTKEYTHRLLFYKTDATEIIQTKTEAMEGAYHRLAADRDGYEIYSYYGEPMALRVEKSSLSEEYIHHLIETQKDAIREFYYSGKKTYDMLARIVFADEDILKNTYHLSEVEVPKPGECILVREVGIPGEPTYATGLSIGDVLKDPHAGEYGDFEDLTITQVVENVDLPYKTMYGEQMIIISKDEGNKIFDRVDCPDYIFFKITDPSAESKINNILSEVADMDLLNIEEEIRKEKQEALEFNVLMIVIFGLLLALVFCHMLLTMWSKVRDERPQSAALYALGVPMRIIKKNIFMEYAEILLEASILGVILGYVAGFLVRMYIRENYYYCSLQISWPEAVLPAIGISLLGLLLLLPMLRSMERMNIRKELQEEDK